MAADGGHGRRLRPGRRPLPVAGPPRGHGRARRRRARLERDPRGLLPQPAARLPRRRPLPRLPGGGGQRPGRRGAAGERAAGRAPVPHGARRRGARRRARGGADRARPRRAGPRPRGRRLRPPHRPVHRRLHRLGRVRRERPGAPPVVYLYLGEVGRLVLLAPFVLARLSSGEPARTWRESRWEALGVATLSPLAYLLVLTAMTFTPVSLVAPAREVSILVGAAFGALLLREGFARRRLAGAAGMVAGVVLLALG